MRKYPNYKLYIAEYDGHVLGTFALLIMDNLANAGTPSGIVEDVAVLQSAQGRGIGKAMMQYAIGKCRENKC
jgi:GNAT superfamily N-acetyltransferase